MKKVAHVLVLCICLTFLYSTTTTAAVTDVKGRVLFISSYSYSWDTVQMQVEGIAETLGMEYELDYEYMDTKRVSDEKAMSLFYDNLEYRMSKTEPYDVIIVGDDAALQFVIQHRKTLFSNIPVVFEGVNDETLINLALKDSLITGVVEKLNVENTLDIAMELIPDATKVVAVLDDTLTGRAERKRFFATQEKYPELEFSELNVSELSTNMLKQRLQDLSEDTILMFIVMTEDADGKQYTSQQAGEFMRTYASVPAFRMIEAGIGDGFAGGDLVSMYKSGEEAAKMAIQIMKGTAVSNVAPIMESPRECIIDEDILRKYHINVKNIPEETTVINHQEDFFEKNEEAIFPLLLLLGIVVIAIFDNYKRRRLVEELKEAKQILENASQHDFLTGLSNRSKFMEDLQGLISKGIPCTVLMLDVDDFKQINDTYGHAAGDITLQEIANRMKDMQTQILTPYRYAGDEFIIILCSEQPMLIEKAAYDCRNVFSKDIKLQGKNYKVSGSIGVATYPKDARDIETLITCADDAMYVVKKSGKNQFAYFKKGMAHEEKK